jgi:hypothetical protein
MVKMMCAVSTTKATVHADVIPLGKLKRLMIMVIVMMMVMVMI